jgi:hypothetical protein
VWAPVLTMWLGDGKAERGEILRSRYRLVIAAKEPWKLGVTASTYEALVATGKEAFAKLREAAGAYGELLDLLKAHKWVSIKLAVDNGFRAALRQNKKIITVGGIVMHLRLVGGRGGSLTAEYYTRNLEKALAAADKLKAAGLRPNIIRPNADYVVYITMADLLRLAERDEAVRRAIALYLAEKAKNGTPRQREIAEKILKRHPLFSNAFLAFSRSVPRFSSSPLRSGQGASRAPSRVVDSGRTLRRGSCPMRPKNPTTPKSDTPQRRGEFIDFSAADCSSQLRPHTPRHAGEKGKEKFKV